MHVSKALQSFAKRYPHLGPVVWIVSIQYFIVQFIVAQAWRLPYSVAHNTISDLGNTACGQYAGADICSPLHNLMNASFIVLGTGMIIGSLLVYQALKKNRASLIGFSYLAIAGIGTILVGIFPENSTSGLHTYGAALPFFVGNLGLLMLGNGLTLPRPLRIYTIISGLIALLALVCFISNSYLGIGEGGMERFIAYPQTIWLIVFGIYMIMPHHTRSAAH